jgi:hypothetical protein
MDCIVLDVVGGVSVGYGMLMKEEMSRSLQLDFAYDGLSLSLPFLSSTTSSILQLSLESHWNQKKRVWRSDKGEWHHSRSRISDT